MPIKGSAPQVQILPPQFIRQHLLRMSNAEFAAALGVTATQITRYEREGRIPEHHHEKVMLLATQRKVKIKKGWFDSVPWASGVPA